MLWNRRHRWRGRRPETLAALAGAAAFLVGYALVLTAVVGSGGPHLAAVLPRDVTVGAPVVAGWLFYNAHFVDVLVSYGDFGVTTTPTNVVADGEFSPLAFAVPPVVLVTAGVVTVRTIGVANSRDAALAGAATALGYLPPAALGAFGFDVSESGGGYVFEAAPELAFAVLLAGLVYPIVFGGIGGVFGVAVGTDGAAFEPA